MLGHFLAGFLASLGVVAMLNLDFESHTRIVCHSGYPKTSRDMTIPIIK
jgi:hypothetical protein